MSESTIDDHKVNRGEWVRAWGNRLQIPEVLSHLGPAFLVGLGGGLGAIVFRWLINLFTRISFNWLPQVTQGMGMFFLVLAPTTGGLIVGFLITRYAPEAKGHGVPEVMEAVALEGGRIRPIVAVIKSVASAITIGSGGSVGREGPIVQIGSALGSTLGQKLNFSEERIRNLVACGAAAGISATFNAPIAGFIFAMEVILGDFGVRNFSSVAIAAVTADVIGRIAFGDLPAFAIPTYELVSQWEYLLYAVLGVLAAIVAAFYVRVVYGAEDFFNKTVKLPEMVKPALGGLLLGLFSLFYINFLGLPDTNIPHVYGVGYDTISTALLGKLTISAAFALMGIKILATALTIGSGGSGGIFAPSLFIGSTLGAGLGAMLTRFLPGITGPQGAYALVGMGAVFAGAAHAPITAVLILFELTDDYRIILPLIMAAGIATILSHHWLRGESIYTLKLSRRGIRLRSGRDVDIMESVAVSEVMKHEPISVQPDLPASELADLFLRHNSHSFPVVDGDMTLLGMVSLADYRRAAQGNQPLKDLKVLDIATRRPLVAYPDESLRVVLRRMAPADLSRVPVLDRTQPTRLVGVIRRNDIVRAYERASAMQGEKVLQGMPKPPGSEVVEFIVSDSSASVGENLAQIGLPRECVVVSIVRNGEVIIPHGDTVLQPGDQVTILLGGCPITDLHPFFKPAADPPPPAPA
ncbi:MAG: chloride channel protein [Anaerolineales bacterium]|jgi:CIC family chloride channel protein